MGPETRAFLEQNQHWSSFAKSLLEQDAKGRPLTDRQLFAILQMIQKMGRKTSVCQVCGRRLTDPQSKADGIGPICKGRIQ